MENKSVRWEPFKASPRSICQSCLNKGADCFEFSKTCGTDGKLGHSYVISCSQFNKNVPSNQQSSLQKLD